GARRHRAGLRPRSVVLVGALPARELRGLGGAGVPRRPERVVLRRGARDAQGPGRDDLRPRAERRHRAGPALRPPADPSGGADAIDLALTPSGVIVRGGLVLGWDEIAEVLVVRDLRIGAAVSRNELEALGGPGITLHPTFVAAHSRIRLALVLHDLGAVADRAVQVAPPRHRSLRA